MKIVPITQLSDKEKSENLAETIECLKESTKYLLISYHHGDNEPYKVSIGGYTEEEVIYAVEKLKINIFDGLMDEYLNAHN